MNKRLNLRFKTVKGAVTLSNDGIDKINSILDNDTSESESESENELSVSADISDDESNPVDISDDEAADSDSLLFSEVGRARGQREGTERAPRAMGAHRRLPRLVQRRDRLAREVAPRQARRQREPPCAKKHGSVACYLSFIDILCARRAM